jgi:hypothetical protein
LAIAAGGKRYFGSSSGTSGIIAVRCEPGRTEGVALSDVRGGEAGESWRQAAESASERAVSGFAVVCCCCCAFNLGLKRLHCERERERDGKTLEQTKPKIIFENPS